MDNVLADEKKDKEKDQNENKKNRQNNISLQNGTKKEYQNK